jgi:eukaryotic-like serine/threonine-protein kinase
MPEGRPNSDDPGGPETIRRFPSERTDLALETPSSAAEDAYTDPHSTIAQTASEGSDLRPAETRYLDSPFPATGTGTGGSFVEMGVVAVEPGQVVFGKYLVLERLGRGGMGEVWLVKDVELDVKRALKMITQGTAFNSEARARFRREARAMAQFSHRNVVTVHDSRLDTSDIAYIVMEYIPGQSLEKVLRPGQGMSLDWTFGVLSQLCEALHVAHRRGIIHRDLKPSNLILIADDFGSEVLKVLDFGIAKILQAEETPQDVQTMVGAFMGTPPYASPEQASGHSEPLSDIYSVGVILYEALTGHRPFRGRTAELIAQTLMTPPASFAEANPDANVPPEIERVVLRCLAKNPEDRPQSPLALLEEFKAAMQGTVVPGVPVKVVPEPLPAAVPGPSRRGLLIGGVIASAALVIALALVLLLNRRPPNRSDDPQAANETTPPATTVDAATVDLKPEIQWEGRSFYLWKGVYLPAGYKPFNAGDLVEGHPRMIVRDGDDVKFLWIKGGQFTMGARSKSEGSDSDLDTFNTPAHPVVVPGFYIQKFEVTNGELRAFEQRQAGAGSDASFEKWRVYDEEVSAIISRERAARHPAREVTWKLATEFARKKGGWLPTEAQWEFAARSGETARVLVWDEKKDREVGFERLANLYRIPPDNVYTSEVGGFPDDQTAQEVMDMTGNVREWCRDRWVPYSGIAKGKPAPLTVDPADDPEMVVRGGSFVQDPSFRFVTRRFPGLRLSDGPASDIGFRIVIECPPVPAPGR